MSRSSAKFHRLDNAVIILEKVSHPKLFIAYQRTVFMHHPSWETPENGFNLQTMDFTFPNSQCQDYLHGSKNNHLPRPSTRQRISNLSHGSGWPFSFISLFSRTRLPFCVRLPPTLTCLSLRLPGHSGSQNILSTILRPHITELWSLICVPCRLLLMYVSDVNVTVN